MDQLSEGSVAVSSVAAKVNLPSLPQLEGVGKNKALKVSELNQVSRAPSTILQDDVKLSSGDDRFITQQIRNEKFNEVATTFRDADKFLAAVGNQINEKRAGIQQYEKQYPPFRNQSSERVEFINSIKSLKNQVDKLTLVKDYKELIPGVNDSTSENKDAGQQDKIGLKIASINSNTPDVEVIQIGRDLTSVGQKLLDSRQQELKETVDQVSNKIVLEDKSIGRKILESDQQVAQTSEKIRQILSSVPVESFVGSESNNVLESLV